MALVVVALNSAIGEFRLRVLHTNDVHARVEQTNVHGGSCTKHQALSNRCYGGVARRRTVVTALRSGHENAILLDAGDQFQGTPWFSFYEGAEAAHFMNRLGYDVMVRMGMVRMGMVRMGMRASFYRFAICNVSHI